MEGLWELHSINVWKTVMFIFLVLSSIHSKSLNAIRLPASVTTALSQIHPITEQRKLNIIVHCSGDAQVTPAGHNQQGKTMPPHITLLRNIRTDSEFTGAQFMEGNEKIVPNSIQNTRIPLFDGNIYYARTTNSSSIYEELHKPLFSTPSSNPPKLPTSTKSSLLSSSYEKGIIYANHQVSRMERDLQKGKIIQNFGNEIDKLLNATYALYNVNISKAEGEHTYLNHLDWYLQSKIRTLYYQQVCLLRQNAIRNFFQKLSTSAESKASVNGAVGSNVAAGRDATTASDTAPSAIGSSKTQNYRKASDPVLLLEEVLKDFKESLLQCGSNHTLFSWPTETIAVDVNLTREALQVLYEQYLRGLEKDSVHLQRQHALLQALQIQQKQLQILQQQLSQATASSPWNAGVAYRLPDSHINLSGAFQNGKTALQLSCVPDESAPLLGPNGFVHGVQPGNLGLSLHLNI